MPKVDPKQKSELLRVFQEHGGLQDGVSEQVARELGVPEAEAYGTASFFHLLSDPNTKVRVCMGLSCQMKGARALLDQAKALGLPAEGVSCLAACDRPPAVLKDRMTLVEVQAKDLERTRGDWNLLGSEREPDLDWRGQVGPQAPDDTLAMNLLGAQDYSGAALAQANSMGFDQVAKALETSGLQGRGGAGFPAHIKWRGVRSQAQTERYVVLNADEGEPGTFKDREVMLRRPDLVLEGLAMAAHLVGAKEVYLYLRGEFGGPWRALEAAINKFEASGALGDVHFHLHAGHGAYICGEETALLEALEGKRGMPRLKPPFPTEVGLFGKPTLIHNVETIACVPRIVQRGGEWFKALGRTGPGSKLYCISGDVKRPGIYELPLGISLDELVSHAGGYEGELYAFSPGGASSGFLPASERGRPLDFKALAEAGSMLGSAGVVVLNDRADLAWAVRQQLRFFEVESCGQCAPCRIGTRFLRERMDALVQKKEPTSPQRLQQAAEVAWEMNEGSICGLGQAAALPLTTTLQYFPEVLSHE